MRRGCIAGMLAFAAFYPAAAVPLEEVAVQQLLSRISLSFSKIPFNIPAKDVKLNMAQTSYVACESLQNCRFTDADHVDHIFSGEEGRLIGKSLSTYHYNTKPMGAFGIGMMRDRADVLAQISFFIGDARYTCEDMQNNNILGKPSGEVYTTCTWAVTKGSVKSSFNSKRQLTYVSASTG